MWHLGSGGLGQVGRVALDALIPGMRPETGTLQGTGLKGN